MSKQQSSINYSQPSELYRLYVSQNLMLSGSGSQGIAVAGTRNEFEQQLALAMTESTGTVTGQVNVPVVGNTNFDLIVAPTTMNQSLISQKLVALLVYMNVSAGASQVLANYRIRFNNETLFPGAIATSNLISEASVFIDNQFKEKGRTAGVLHLMCSNAFSVIPAVPATLVRGQTLNFSPVRLATSPEAATIDKVRFEAIQMTGIAGAIIVPITGSCPLTKYLPSIVKSGYIPDIDELYKSASPMYSQEG